MESAGQAFKAFEQSGWEDPGVVATYHERLSRVTTQCTGALLDAGGVTAGSRVLDVATGAGYVAAEAARRGAQVVGIDLSAGQVALARATNPALRFEQADAEALPFADGSFDVVVNAFGMCHLPDPDRALREAHRVLAPGGCVAFSVWDVPERTVGFGAPYAAIRAHGTLSVELPQGPNFFLFSDPARACGALEAAGFSNCTTAVIAQWWTLGDPDELFQMVQRATVRAAATLRAQSPEALAAIREELRRVVAGYPAEGGYRLPMPAVIAYGRK